MAINFFFFLKKFYVTQTEEKTKAIIITTMNQRFSFIERYKKSSLNITHLTPKSYHIERLFQHSTASVFRIAQH